jgi:hypothetical protein
MVVQEMGQGADTTAVIVWTTDCRIVIGDGLLLHVASKVGGNMGHLFFRFLQADGGMRCPITSRSGFAGAM